MLVALVTSTFDEVSYGHGSLRFRISPGDGAIGLQAMLPITGPSGRLGALRHGRDDVAFARTTITGVEYGRFAAREGAYSASYTTSSVLTEP